MSDACATLAPVTRPVTEMPAAPGPAGDTPSLTAADLQAITGGMLLRRSTRLVRGAAVDSRLVEPGNLFVALAGERTDGHQFLEQAVARGAAALLVARDPGNAAALGDVTVLRVVDPLTALQAVAGAWRARFDPLVVGITGSVAKTSTKEATAAVLATRLVTLRSEGNQNNEIGIPLTVLRLGPEHQAAVLEMGMYVGGEIATLAAIGRPSIGIVTAIAPVHLERAGSMQAIVEAKAELVEALPPDGTAVLNGDDPAVAAMAGRARGRVLTYGLAPGASVGAEAVLGRGPTGMSFELVAREPRPARFQVTIPALGRHSVANALAAAVVGLLAGLSDEEIASGLATPWGTAAGRRSSLVRAGGITVLDDSYNASPPSMRAALELLATLGGRPLAVLGEMLELGPLAEAAHREVGACAAAVVAELVVVGQGAAAIADGAEAAGLDPARVHRVAGREEALAVLRRVVREGDVVLVKASRGAALDVLADALIEDRR
ncbi:MAG: murF [Chloroflexi bacterium]|nr:murF [Chloroflexota bacterium]